MDDKTDLKKFFVMLKRRRVIIAVTMLSFLFLSVIATFFVIKPTYEASENIVVGKLKKEEGYYGETQEVYMLLASTKDFIKSPTVLTSVQKELEFKDDKLEEKIVVKNNKDSQIVSVIVRGKNPEQTRLIAETTVVTTVNKMNMLFGVSEIKVLADSEGQAEVERVGSNALNIAIGSIIGLLFGVGIALLREYFDDTIKDSKEVEEVLGLVLLGEINLYKDQEDLGESIDFMEGEKGGGLSV